ncbi:hypothetical protein M3898_000620 [Vibrio metschnikovii]|nr:hypothetical protein [Vibrio metschnikovii]
MKKNEQPKEIYIEQIIRETNQGQTSPYLCKDDNSETYIVKGSRTTGLGLAKEWVCARLGEAFGLPIPPYTIAWVDSPFLESGYGLYEYNFASKFISGIQDITLVTLKQVPQNIVNDLYIFDYWIQNADRNLTECGGNPNLFVDQRNGAVYVLDHNLAFDETFCVEQHKALHVCHCRQEWTSLIEVDRQTYTVRFEKALSLLDSIMEEIPDDWLVMTTREELKDSLLAILQRYKQDKFWEDII